MSVAVINSTLLSILKCTEPLPLLCCVLNGFKRSHYPSPTLSVPRLHSPSRPPSCLKLTHARTHAHTHTHTHTHARTHTHTAWSVDNISGSVSHGIMIEGIAMSVVNKKFKFG